MTTNLILRYSIELGCGLFNLGFFLVCLRYMDRNPRTRLFKGVPLSLAWMCGSLALYSLCQAVFPFMATPRFDSLGNSVALGVGALASVFFLRRARYVENAAALLVLLSVLFLLALPTIAAALPHPASPPSFPAYLTAWSAIGSVALLPCRMLNRWLQMYLGPILPLPSYLQPARIPRHPSHWLQDAIRISVFGACISLTCAIWLFTHHQLSYLVAALPWTGAFMFGLYVLSMAISWGLRYLFFSRPLYGLLPSPLATGDTVTDQSFDEQQISTLFYQVLSLPARADPGPIKARNQSFLRASVCSGGEQVSAALLTAETASHLCGQFRLKLTGKIFTVILAPYGDDQEYAIEEARLDGRYAEGGIDFGQDEKGVHVALYMLDAYHCLAEGEPWLIEQDCPVTIGQRYIQFDCPDLAIILEINQEAILHHTTPDARKE